MKRFLYLICILALASTAVARLGAARRIAAPAAVVTGGGGGGTLLLDESGLGSAGAAYSVRKLRAAYSGYFLRIRRSSDNKEADFGDDGTGWITASSVAANGSDPALDGQTLATFFSGTDGFVTTAFDQSTNSRNATQTTSSYQPQMVSGGSLITGSNSRPCWRGDGDSVNGDGLLTSSFTLAQDNMFVVVFKPDSILTDKYVIGYPPSGSLVSIYTHASSPAQGVHMYAGTVLSGGADSSTTWRLYEAFFNGVSSQSWKNGASLATGNAGSNSVTGGFYIGRSNAGGALDGDFSEVVLFDSNSGRTTIEANVNAAYVLY